MAFNPMDYFKDLIPDNINMFGAGPSATTQSLLDNNFIDADAYKKAQQQSIFQGLLNTGLSYAAQPKNQGYGSIFPYLAKAGISGVNAAQKPFNQLTQDVMTSEKIEAMKRAKDRQIKKDDFLSTWGQDNTGKMMIDGDQNVNVAAQGLATGQDYDVGSKLMGGRDVPNLMNIQSPNFDIKPASIQSLLDNQLLGSDPESFLLDNNNLEQKMVGSFDPMKAIDDAVANGALELKDALAMKASIATASAKGGVMATDPNKDIRDKTTGELLFKGKTKENFTLLDENQLQQYEANNRLKVGSTRRFDKNGNRITYQLNGETDQISVLNGGGGGVNIENNIGDQASKLNVGNITKDLQTKRETAMLAHKNLSRVRGAYNLISQAPVGAFSKQLETLNRFKTKFNSNADYRAAIEAATSSEQLRALLGGDVFPLIKILGIGARGLDTPAERDFLISVMTGSNTMTEETLKAITSRRLRQSDDAIRAYNKSLSLGHYNKVSQDFLEATQATDVGDRYSPLVNQDGIVDTYIGTETKSATGDDLIWDVFPNGVRTIQDRDGNSIQATNGWMKWQKVKGI